MVDIEILKYGLKNDYSRMSESASAMFVKLGIRMEAIQLDACKEDFGVSEVIFHDNYPFLLICLDLNLMNV